MHCNAMHSIYISLENAAVWQYHNSSFIYVRVNVNKILFRYNELKKLSGKMHRVLEDKCASSILKVSLSHSPFLFPLLQYSLKMLYLRGREGCAGEEAEHASHSH